VGVSTSRDAWVYNFSYNPCVDNAQSMVKNYNSEIERLKNINDKNTLLEKANTSSDFINWSAALRKKFIKKEKITLTKNVVKSMYRPFVKKWLYYDNQVIERPGASYSLFNNSNKVIYCTGIGAKREFSCIMTD